VWVLCALLGRGIAAVVCGLQRDVKALVAYRRVAHINYILVVMCFGGGARDTRRRILLLSHSFVRRVMFMLAGGIFHTLGTRIVYLFRGAFG
jgi:formate hydrogenlyase subunit 3/multisubunit Na+/H+ antiporter MnhD subunit